MRKKTAIINVLSSIIYQVVALIYGLVVPKLIIEHFGSNTNGLISSIAQFLSYISLLEMGIFPVIKNSLFEPLVKKDTKKLSDILGTTKKFFKNIAIVFVFYIFILFIIYPILINKEFGFLYTSSLILIISISTLFEYFLGMTYKVILQADQKNYLIDFVNIGSYIISFINTFILLKLGSSIHIIKLFSSLIYIIKPIILKNYFDKKYKISINKASDYKLEKKYDGISHHIASVVQSNTDVVVLTLFSSLTNVSIYSVYSLVTNGIRSIIISFTNGIDSFFGKMMVNDNNDVNLKFDLYCFIFYTLTTIVLGCSIILIIPFIRIYTSKILDANYINELFAYLLIFAEFIYVCRYPYSTIVYAKGHFKETKNFSVIEPIVNIVLSVILVIKYGIIGVAIGTLISMTIRTYGFINYGSKNILNKSTKKSMKIIYLSLLELLLLLIVNIWFINLNPQNYFVWFLIAFICFTAVSLFVLVINFFFYKKYYLSIFKILGGRKHNE